MGHYVYNLRDYCERLCHHFDCNAVKGKFCLVCEKAILDGDVVYVVKRGVEHYICSEYE